MNNPVLLHSSFATRKTVNSYRFIDLHFLLANFISSAFYVNFCCCFIHRFRCLFLWLAIHTRMWTRYLKCYLDFLSSVHSHSLGFAIDLNATMKTMTMNQKASFLRIHSGVCPLSKTQRDYQITLIQHLRTITRVNHIFVFNYS